MDWAICAVAFMASIYTGRVTLILVRAGAAAERSNIALALGTLAFPAQIGLAVWGIMAMGWWFAGVAFVALFVVPIILLPPRNPNALATGVWLSPALNLAVIAASVGLWVWWH